MLILNTAICNSVFDNWIPHEIIFSIICLYIVVYYEGLPKTNAIVVNRSLIPTEARGILKPSRPSDAYMRLCCRPPLVQIMACRLLTTTPPLNQYGILSIKPLEINCRNCTNMTFAKWPYSIMLRAYCVTSKHNITKHVYLNANCATRHHEIPRWSRNETVVDS